MGHIIKSVPEGSLAAELGLLPGDEILALNGEALVDVIDYQALQSGTDLTVAFRRGGEEQEVECEKEEWEELGVEFMDGLLKTRVCQNHCIFCFIDQMPPNCRPSLYVKDDDWRMSLMMGNFVTLTNVNDEEMQRIVRRHASPLYISVHATNPEVRRRMMRNPRAGNILAQLRTLKEAGIRFHCQIVLCPGENDGEVLEETLTDLLALRPAAQSVAVVPVGLTGFRQGLYPLRPFSPGEADALLRQVSRWQKKCWKEIGTRFVFASDEFYCLAGRSIPAESCYEDFPQIENGVGLFATLRAEFEDALSQLRETEEEKRFTIACGVSVAPLLSDMIFAHKWRHLKLSIVPVRSGFFGGAVTVTGLVAGQDLVRDLRGREDLGTVLIVESMLRAEGDLFLDDMTLSEVRAAVGAPVRVIENTGAALAEALCTGSEDENG